MIRFYFRAIFFMFNLGMLLLPIVMLIMAGYSFVLPNENHKKLLSELTKGVPILIGYSGGSYSCIGADCDYSNYVKEHSYIVLPDTFESKTFFSVSQPYNGELSVATYEQSQYYLITLFLLMLTYGILMARYYYQSRITHC